MATIPTNCGEIKPQTFDIQTMQPDVKNSHIPYFHQMLCKWAYGATMNFSWVMVLHAKNKNNILKKINDLSGRFEPSGWEMGEVAKKAWSEDAHDVIGCIFAQAVRLPGENVGVEYAGVTTGSRRGFINAPIINGRSDFASLECGFLETTQSFVDGVLRPWNIIIGHEGLLARSTEESIKCNIDVYQLAKNSQNTHETNEHQPNIIRKAWTFYDAAPINVSAEDLKYDSQAAALRQAAFVYDYYTIKGGANGANI